MHIVRVVLMCSIGCLVAMTSGSGRAAFRMWNYTYENLGGETFSNVIVAYPGQSWPLGDDFRGGGAEKSMGVMGRMPKAVTLSFTSKDKRQHSIYVVIPPRPRGYDPAESPQIYFVTESRCKAIATWADPDTAGKGMPKWYYIVKNNSSDKVFGVAGHGRTMPQFYFGANLMTVKDGLLPKAVDVILRTPDGVRHDVNVILPAPAHSGPPWPRVHLLVHSNGKITAKCAYPQVIKPPQRWFCAVGDSGQEQFSHITVAGNGESYRLGDVGPKADTALGALGRMPKALELGFTAADGKHHQVRVQVPAPPASQGKQPEIYLIVKSPGKIRATYICPTQLAYKPRPYWQYTLTNHSGEIIPRMTISYSGKSYRLGAWWQGTSNPDGIPPKTMDISFATPDGKRHTAHIALPAFRGSGVPSYTLTIEKGGKVTATLTH